MLASVMIRLPLLGTSGGLAEAPGLSLLASVPFEAVGMADEAADR